MPKITVDRDHFERKEESEREREREREREVEIEKEGLREWVRQTGVIR